MMTLRDRLRAGDVWVEGSRAFRAFDDFLLPPQTFATRRQDGELGLAVVEFLRRMACREDGAPRNAAP